MTTVARLGSFGKACKKCASDQKPKNDENSPVVQSIIRDGSVGTAHNCCQIDIGCQPLQGWYHLAMHARNVQLIRSRGMMETVDGYKDGTTWEGVQEICN